MDWISVEDRLPENGQLVNCAWHGEVFPAGFQVIDDDAEFFNLYLQNGCGYAEWSPVTHWMPLPDPPEVNDG